MIDLDKIRTKEYYRRTKMSEPDFPCQVCGRAVKDPEYYIHICHGGHLVVTEAECSKDDGNCLALHPLGKDCAKKLQANPEIAKYVIHIDPHSERFPEHYPAGVRPSLEDVLKSAEEAAKLDTEDGFDTQLIFPPATEQEMLEVVDMIADEGDGGDGFNAQYVDPADTENKE